MHVKGVKSRGYSFCTSFIQILLCCFNYICNATITTTTTTANKESKNECAECMLCATLLCVALSGMRVLRMRVASSRTVTRRARQKWIDQVEGRRATPTRGESRLAAMQEMLRHETPKVFNITMGTQGHHRASLWGFAAEIIKR